MQVFASKLSQTGKIFPQELIPADIAARVCRFLRDGWNRKVGFSFATVVDERLKNESSRAGLQDLRGGGDLVEVIGRTLGVSGCREDGTVVVLQNL